MAENVLLKTIFQWTKFDIIFQFLGASPPDSHQGPSPGPRWGTSVPRPPDSTPPPQTKFSRAAYVHYITFRGCGDE